jgi:predicted metal-dependent TIM-barrel fold hydrolase
MNLVAYMQDAELVHAAVAGLALVCVLAHFPFTSRVVQRIEDHLQRSRDEQQFRS